MPSHPKNPGFRKQVLNWLGELDHKAFAELFYEAVATRTTSDLKEWRGHFILADCEKVDDSPWDLDLIALPVESERADWAEGVPICQSGTCESCGAEVRCWSKRAECPVCATAVYCT